MKNCGPSLFIYFFRFREIIKFLWVWFCICETGTAFGNLHLGNAERDGSAVFVCVRLRVGGYSAILISQDPNKTSAATGRKYPPHVLSPTGESSCASPPAGDALAAAESLEELRVL